MGVVGYVCRLRTVCLWATVVVVGCRCRTGLPMGDSVWVLSGTGYVSSVAGYGRVPFVQGQRVKQRHALRKS